jgi:predicted permease
LQIGLSLLLLVCSGLFVRTLHNLRNVNVGFATDHLITFGLEPNLAGYSKDTVLPVQKRVLESLAALPGVADVGATDDPELADNGESGNISVQGYTAAEEEDMNAERPYVTPDYFAVLKAPLLAGRTFTDADDAMHPAVAVVNETLAKRFFGSPQNALGRRLAHGAGNKTKYDIEIVGVVRDYVHRGMRGKVKMTVYHPVAQNSNPAGLHYYVRTWGAPDTAMRTIRNTIQQIDSKLVIDGLSTMDAEIDQNINDERVIALLAVSFGVLATLLAGIGLYGVLAYATAQRTREIGVRMALGSDRRGIVTLVLKDVLKLAGISIAVAVPVAVAATRVLKSQLFGVSNADPIVLVSATVLVAIVAMIAAALPARRAASVEPMHALRTE